MRSILTPLSVSELTINIQMPLILDAHEDLAYNMLLLGRDYTRSAAETRERERGTQAPVYNGDTLLGWPDYQRGRVAIVFGTLFSSPRRQLTADQSWDTLAYSNADEAHSIYRAELDAYHRLVEDHPDLFCLVGNRRELKETLARWLQPAPQEGGAETPAAAQVGIVPLMEGAEGVRAPGELEEWWQAGLRIIGLAWAGTRFCGGTREPGPLTKEGREMLEAMAPLGFTLDLSHMDAESALQALDMYQGPIIASHANPLGMLNGSDSNRHIPDEVVDGIIERDGVIGIVPFNVFLKAGWKKGDRKEGVSLRDMAAHIDYICQRAGDARHVAIGSDFDGGFGVGDTPAEVDTIADLQKLVPLLEEKGYSAEDASAILGGNWIAHLEKSLPQ